MTNGQNKLVTFVMKRKKKGQKHKFKHAPVYRMQQHVKPSLYFWTVGKCKETAGLRGCSSNIQFIAVSYDDVSLSLTFCLYKSWLVLLHLWWLPSLSAPPQPPHRLKDKMEGGDQAVKSLKSLWRREPSRLRVWSASSPHRSAASF